MTKLKLATVKNDKPVKLTVALPAALDRDLLAHAEILSRESGSAARQAGPVGDGDKNPLANGRGASVDTHAGTGGNF